MSAEDFFQFARIKGARDRYRPISDPRADFWSLRDGLLTGVGQCDLRHPDLPDDQQLVPVGSCAGREFPAFHLPGFCDAFGGGEDLVLAIAGVQGVYGLVELRGTGWLCGGEEIALTGRTGKNGTQFFLI